MSLRLGFPARRQRKRLGKQFVRPQALGMRVDHRRHHDFLDAGLCGQAADLGANALRVAEDQPRPVRLHLRPLGGRVRVCRRFFGAGDDGGAARVQPQPGQVKRLGQFLGLIGSPGADHRGGHKGVRLREMGRWNKIVSIQVHGLGGPVRVDMVGEGEAQPARGGDLGAVVAGAEQPHGRQRDPRRDRADKSKRVAFGKRAFGEGEEVIQQGRQIVRPLARTQAPQGQGSARVRPRRPPDAQVNAARKQGFQSLERLGHFQRRMVRQHDAAGADAQVGSLAGDLPDEYLRRRTRDAGHVVVFRQPVAGEAQPLRLPRQVQRVLQRLHGGRTGYDGRQIENGQGKCHAFTMPGRWGKVPREVNRAKQKDFGAERRTLSSDAVHWFDLISLGVTQLT